MRQLVVAALVDSRRGHHGGFALARAPGEIRMFDILEAVEESFDATHCAFGWKKCDASRPCVVHHVWGDARDKLTEWATTHTLAEVRAPPPRRRAP